MLSDLEQAKVASYGHVVGRHTKKAIACHGARFSATRHSLCQFLAGYVPNQHDESLTEPVNWASQSEYFSDARRDIVLSAPSLVRLIEHVPVICRTLTVHMPLPHALPMNAWLAKVVSMPTIMVHVTSRDFFERFKDRPSSHGENVNSIMLVSRDPRGLLLSSGFGRHMASYFLTRNSEIFLADAHLATWAMVAVYILNRAQQTEWMLAELETIRFMHAAVYCSTTTSWANYVKVVGSDGFAHALSLKSDMSTPHLNKFLLAVFFLRDLNKEQLQARRDAAIVEHVSRLKIPNASEVFSFGASPSKIIEDVDFELFPTVSESLRAFNMQLRSACMFAIAKRDVLHMMCRRSIMGSVKLDSLESRKFDQWNLNPLVIERVFASIGRLGGVELEPVADWPSLVVLGIEGRPYDKSAMEAEMVARFLNHLRGMAKGFVMVKFNHLSWHSHQGLPVLVTREFAAEFQEKHGRDLLAELDVNEYGLSRCACLFPLCGFFGRPLGKRYSKGTPRMNDKLKQHLSIFGHIKGVHRQVLSRPSDSTDVIVNDIVGPHLSMSPWVNVDVVDKIREKVPYETLESIFLSVLTHTCQ